uniref:Uncharacterized protein n=1 Tax=viral metagenome TaxID=1070528 RepID=A0A6M3LMR1_9ZZZZ
MAEHKSCENCIQHGTCEVEHAIMWACDGGGFLHFCDMETGGNNGMEKIASICYFWKDKEKVLWDEWQSVRLAEHNAELKYREYMKGGTDELRQK